MSNAYFTRYQISEEVDGNPYTFFFLAPANHYDNIDTLAGVSKVTNDKLSTMPVTKVEELLKSPVATRRVVVYEKNSRKHYADVIVATSKAAAFETGIEGQNYKGGSITGVTERLRATFR